MSEAVIPNPNRRGCSTRRALVTALYGEEVKMEAETLAVVSPTIESRQGSGSPARGGGASSSQFETVPELDPRQARAMQAILAGHSISAAASLANVARSTVHRWIRSDVRFQAALNRARRELRQEIGMRLFVLAISAFEVVEDAVRNGNVRASLAVLRAVGVLTEPTIGPEDPREIASLEEAAAHYREQQIADRRRRFRLPSQSGSNQ